MYDFIIFNLQGQKVHGGEINAISEKINTQNYVKY